jgi:DNA-binding Lrp family transcriptional regulator
MSVRAFILIETEVGMADAVSMSVREISGVVSADDVTGPYDVIVQAEAATVHDLGKLVVSKVQLIEGITKTLTCPVISL